MSAFRSIGGRTVTSGTSVTVPKPTSIVDGDQMFIIVSSTGGNTTPTTVPTGWVKQSGPDKFDGTGGGTDRWDFCYTKVASSESGDYTFSGFASGTLAGRAVSYQIDNTPTIAAVGFKTYPFHGGSTTATDATNTVAYTGSTLRAVVVWIDETATAGTSFANLSSALTNAYTDSFSIQIGDQNYSAGSPFPARQVDCTDGKFGTLQIISYVILINDAASSTNYSKSISESLSAPTEAPTRSTVVARGPSESVSTTEALTRSTVLARGPSEPLSTPTEAPTRSTTHTRSASESISAPAEDVTRAVVVARALDEAIDAPTDDIAHAGTTFARAVDEAIDTPSDDVVRAVVTARAFDETTDTTDDVARSAVVARETSESIDVPADVVVGAFTFSRFVSESIDTPTDAVSHAGNVFSRNVAENVSSPIDVVVRIAFIPPAPIVRITDHTARGLARLAEQYSGDGGGFTFLPIPAADATLAVSKPVQTRAPFARITDHVARGLARLAEQYS